MSRAHVVEGGTVISVIIHLPKHMPHCLVEVFVRWTWANIPLALS